MITAYKERSVQVGQKVMVYFNLHTQLFSMKDAETGLVLGHGTGIMLEFVEFKVQQGGRERVLRDKQKNVHAFVIGTYIGTCEAEKMTFPMRDAYYNPYKQDSFTDKESGMKLSHATVCYLNNKQVKYL